jgi:radical SAM modification target selenobiotic family peptide
MDVRELKKFLAGFGIAGLLAGAGLILGGNFTTAEAS